MGQNQGCVFSRTSSIVLRASLAQTEGTFRYADLSSYPAQMTIAMAARTRDLTGGNKFPRSRIPGKSMRF